MRKRGKGKEGRVTGRVRKRGGGGRGEGKGGRGEEEEGRRKRGRVKERMAVWDSRKGRAVWHSDFDP